MDYYLSRPMGNEEEGRSQVISSDVRDIVEGLTPSVLRPFISSDDVVRFNALGPDDEDAAQQETDYINWVVTQKNDVFNELVAAVKTGLLQKNAVAKYWWEKSRKATIERYFGISDDEFAMISQEEGVEVIEHTDAGKDAMGEPIHDVTLRFVDEVGEARYQVLPPEEFLIGRDATSSNPKRAQFVQHRSRVTLSYLREMGHEIADDVQDMGPDPSFTLQWQARHYDDSDAQGARFDNGMLDPAAREVLYKETLILADFDGDGITELRKVCSVGREILSNEETEEINFVAWTPNPQPFKFYGRCPADDGIEFQDIKTTLLRQELDNIYTINNNRVYASSKVNLDDLLDNQIAGVVRVDGDDVGRHVQAAEITPIGQIIQGTIEYLDSAKENRTGLTRYNQGTDSDSLNKTATGIRVITQKADARTELVSRAFAEQFLAPLMLGIHGLCRRHATKAETIQLRGEWVNVDPRQWKTRNDMSVSVGLGTADQQLKMQGAQMLVGSQMQLLQSPAAALVTPDNLYNSHAQLASSLGHKQPEQFFTHPKKAPPAPPAPPPPEMVKIQNEHDVKMRQLDLEQFQKSLDERKVQVLEHDSLVRADIGEATVGIQAQAAGIDAHTQIMDSLQSLQQLMHSMQLANGNQLLAAQAQDHSQTLDAAQHGMAAQDQAHSQVMDVAQHALAAQGQAHSQEMAENPPEPANGPA